MASAVRSLALDINRIGGWQGENGSTAAVTFCLVTWEVIGSMVVQVQFSTLVEAPVVVLRIYFMWV
ncbi:MAG: hypothetical protein ABL902_06405 [Gallionella sp.]